MIPVKKDIKYLNKDFVTFRDNLLSFVKSYFKDTVQSFDESDPTMMYIELMAYVGDVLSFYIDNNLKESLLLHATDRKNVIALANMLGYKSFPTTAATTDLNIYQVVPATGTGANIGPDLNYALKIQSGLQVSGNGVLFIYSNPIDFSINTINDPLTVTIYQVDINNIPEYYLLKKTIKVSSGTQKTITVNITDAEKFKKILLTDKNILSVDSMIDSDGNDWFEVPYLAQDVIFESTRNTGADSDVAPYILKYKRAPKRFITRYKSDDTMEIQFGSGISSEYDEEILPDFDNVGFTLPTGISKLNYSWDIANFMFSKSYGQVPSNTTLTITYTLGGGIQSNVPAGTINKIVTATFDTVSGLNQTIADFVKTTLACTNTTPATGGRGQESIEEIRNNALAYFAAQNRAVTRDDYICRTLTMPGKFGSVAKAFIVQDEQLDLYEMRKKIKNPLTLNLYVLSYDNTKKLVQTNNTIKTNLVSYIDNYRMLTDSINIKDAYVINIGVRFTITVLSEYNSKEVLLKCIMQLKDYFSIDKWKINQPIVITDVQRKIADVKGVQSVIDVTIENYFDTQAGYFSNVYDIESSTIDGVLYPSLDPSIFEVRYPDRDIIGRVISY